MNQSVGIDAIHQVQAQPTAIEVEVVGEETGLAEGVAGTIPSKRFDFQSE